MLRWIGRGWLWLFGWRVEGSVPADAPKLVFIAAPHTSNWDLPFMLAVSWVLGIRLGFMGKHDLFVPPLGWLMRALGGVPVDRRAPQGLVAQMAAEFAQRPRFALAIPPEGTRSLTRQWKTGFYRIAQAAKVPIACGFLDFRRRCGGVGPLILPGGDMQADMERIAAFYSDITGKHPERFGPVRWPSEPAERTPPVTKTSSG